MFRLWWVLILTVVGRTPVYYERPLEGQSGNLPEFDLHLFLTLQGVMPSVAKGVAASISSAGQIDSDDATEVARALRRNQRTLEHISHVLASLDELSPIASKAPQVQAPLMQLAHYLIALAERNLKSQIVEFSLPNWITRGVVEGSVNVIQRELQSVIGHKPSLKDLADPLKELLGSGRKSRRRKV